MLRCHSHRSAAKNTPVTIIQPQVRGASARQPPEATTQPSSITPPKATRQNAETVGGVPASSTMMPLVPMIAAPASIQASALGSLREWVTEDRKSAGSGQSVSVRADHGGRRIIKKQKSLKL